MTKEKLWQSNMIDELEKNGRISFMELSRKLNIPVSTLHDYFRVHIKPFYSFTMEHIEL